MTKPSFIFSVLLFTFFSLHSYAQKTTYIDGTIKFRNSEGGEAPIGNNVTLIYDSFFKNYKIVYDNSEGWRETINFEFVTDGSKRQIGYEPKGAHVKYNYQLYGIFESTSSWGGLFIFYSQNHTGDYYISGTLKSRKAK